VKTIQQRTHALEAFDPALVRADFPILSQRVHQKPLAYLDNGATTQKPQAVINAISNFYARDNANIHRAVHTLSQRSTDAFESARKRVARFLNAPSSDEIVFTRGTTESINLVAHSFTSRFCKPGDEILISTLEHHSNIVPWQLAAERLGLVLKVIPIDDTGELLYDAIPDLISDRTKLVSITHTSNALGTEIDVARIAKLAHALGARILVDGAQWVGHRPTDVRALDCDFYVFSAHKLFGPTGVGVLWGRRELLDDMPPYHGGGDMIRTVSFNGSTWADLPNKFEAGTPDIAGVIGLSAAIEYLADLDSRFDPASRLAHEDALLKHCVDGLTALGVRIIGTARKKAAVVSFRMERPDVDHHTLATLLDTEAVAVRSGHHCCMPLMDRLGIPGTVRASMSFYNNADDIDRLISGVKKIRDNFARPHANASATTPSIASSDAAHAAEQDIPFAPAFASSPEDAARQLIEDFDLFDDWEQKHEYLLDLGRTLKILPTRAMCEANRVQGCQSTVHLVGRERPSSPHTLEFAAYADAFIVNGLIALLTRLFSGQRAADVLAFDTDAFFARIGLSHHLSMGRRNGLAGMVSRIRLLAASIADESTLKQLRENAKPRTHV
jgi:cysteine desulfurase/selenocysteine lyase